MEALLEEPLTSSFEGLLLLQITELRRTRGYDLFSAFVRGREVRSWLKANLIGRGGEKIDDAQLVLALEDLDHRQAEFLPESVDDIAPRTKGVLRAVFEFVLKELRKKEPRAMLRSILSCATPRGRFPVVGGNQPLASSSPQCATLPDAWRLNLPIPPASTVLEKISPTAVDAYLRCPFTYCLTRAFGDKPFVDRAHTLERWEFGNVVHEVLERWGASPEQCDSSDARTIAATLLAMTDTVLAERFGAHVPVSVAEQADDIKRRLSDFAAIQAKRRRDGWRIVAVERKLEMSCGHTMVYGRCDRIDFHEERGIWCVIDYKTWDRSPERLDSLQLPLYRAMLDACDDGDLAGAKWERTVCAHCILGKGSENVLFAEQVLAGEKLVVEKRLVSAIDGIEHGVFWPPSPARLWHRAFGRWMFANRPEMSVRSAWLEDQKARTGWTGPSDVESPSAVSGTPALNPFLDYIQLGDHPSDLVSYRRFASSPLAAALYPAGVPAVRDVSCAAAVSLVERGLSGTLSFLRQALTLHVDEAWDEFTEAQFAGMMIAAAEFERTMRIDSKMSDFLAIDLLPDLSYNTHLNALK